VVVYQNVQAVTRKSSREGTALPFATFWLFWPTVQGCVGRYFSQF
jgi:hypothetical protein